MSIHNGSLGAFYVKTTAAAVVFTTEAMTDGGDHTTYTITNSAKKYWDKETAVIVYKNGVAQNSSTYELQYAGGQVVFKTALVGTEVITVSGAYVTLEQAGGFFNWQCDSGVELEEVKLLSETWVRNVPVGQNFSVSAESYFLVSNEFSERLSEYIIVVLYTNESVGSRFEGVALIDSDSISTPADGLINESISMKGDGMLSFRAA